MAGRIGTAETPESQVAIRTAVGPNESKAEPNPLDEASSLRPVHRRTLTDRAFADSFGKSELHQNRPSLSTVLCLAANNYEEGAGLDDEWNGGGVYC